MKSSGLKQMMIQGPQRLQKARSKKTKNVIAQMTMCQSSTIIEIVKKQIADNT